MSGTTSQQRGRLAEEEALARLQSYGLRLIERNFSSRFGEIDLVMQEGGSLVFVEVRYRSSSRFGSAQESVTRGKQTRLLATANLFLKRHIHRGPVRFDVVALFPGKEGLEMDWIKGAFQAH